MRLGFRTIQIKDSLTAKIFLKMIKTIIPAGVFGGAEIKGITPDGVLTFSYADVGEANKILVGNDAYFKYLKEKMLENDKIPGFIKTKIGNLLESVDTTLNESDEIELNEKRRNPHLNPKEFLVSMLDRYAKEDDVYVSFTEIDKIGLNPKSRYDTPLGIYCYPLKAAAEYYKRRDNGMIHFPFAAQAPFINILRAKPEDKILVISKYTDEDSNKDIEILRKKYEEELKKDGEDFDVLLKNASDTTNYKKYPVGTIWNFMRIISDKMSKGKASTTWNVILKTVLGYDLIVDDKAYGVIHSAERCQALFTHTGGFNLIQRVKNTPTKTLSLSSIKDPEKRYKTVKNIIYSRGKDLTENQIDNIFYAVDSSKKDEIAWLIFNAKKHAMSDSSFGTLIQYVSDKNKMLDELIEVKGKNLTDGEIYSAFQNQNKENRYAMALKILALKSNDISDRAFNSIVEYNPALEQLKKFIEIRGKNLTGENISALLSALPWSASSELRDEMLTLIINNVSHSLDSDKIATMLRRTEDETLRAKYGLLFVKLKGTGLTDEEGARILNYNRKNKEIWDAIYNLKKDNLSTEFAKNLIQNAPVKSEAISLILATKGKEILSPELMYSLIVHSEDAAAGDILKSFGSEKIAELINYCDSYSIQNLFEKRSLRKILPQLIIQVKGANLSSTDIGTLMEYSLEKDETAQALIKLLGNSLSADGIWKIVKYSSDKASILTQLGMTNLAKLDSSYFNDILSYTNDNQRDSLISMVLQAKGDNINHTDMEVMLKYASNKSQIIKLLLPKLKGKLTSDVIQVILRHSQNLKADINILGKKNVISILSNLGEYELNDFAYTMEGKDELLKLVINVKKNKLTDNMASALLAHSSNKRDVADTILTVKGNTLSDYLLKRIFNYVKLDIPLVNKIGMDKFSKYLGQADYGDLDTLLYSSTQKQEILNLIIKIKASTITSDMITTFIGYAKDKKRTALDIIAAKGNALTSNDVNNLVLSGANNEHYAEVLKALGTTNLNKLTDRGIYYYVVYGNAADADARMLEMLKYIPREKMQTAFDYYQYKRKIPAQAPLIQGTLPLSESIESYKSHFQYLVEGSISHGDIAKIKKIEAQVYPENMRDISQNLQDDATLEDVAVYLECSPSEVYVYVGDNWYILGAVKSRTVNFEDFACVGGMKINAAKKFFEIMKSFGNKIINADCKEDTSYKLLLKSSKLGWCNIIADDEWNWDNVAMHEVSFTINQEKILKHTLKETKYI
jgi:hypothetical protein